MVGVIRIELMTSSMSTKHSTTELHAPYLNPYFLIELIETKNKDTIFLKKLNLLYFLLTLHKQKTFFSFLLDLEILDIL